MPLGNLLGSIKNFPIFDWLVPEFGGGTDNGFFFCFFFPPLRTQFAFPFLPPNPVEIG